METKLFRRIIGGTWHLYKFGKDAPMLRMFMKWMLIAPDEMDMSQCVLLAIEKHPQRRWTLFFTRYE